MSDVSPIPDGYRTVTPYLIVKGAKKACEFYQKAFDAVIVMQSPMPDGETLLNAQIRIGDSMIMLNDEFPDYGSVGPETLGNTTVSIHLYVEDCDAAFAKAVEAGCTPVFPPSDAFWGDRFGMVLDPFGHKWSIGTKIKEPTPEEYEAGMKDAFQM